MELLRFCVFCCINVVSWPWKKFCFCNTYNSFSSFQELLQMDCMYYKYICTCPPNRSLGILWQWSCLAMKRQTHRAVHSSHSLYWLCTIHYAVACISQLSESEPVSFSIRRTGLCTLKYRSSVTFDSFVIVIKHCSQNASPADWGEPAQFEVVSLKAAMLPETRTGYKASKPGPC